ncbi:MAG: hypothetical protein DMF64_16870 [Acidobacteria bacterium]|nr:MAG: hypothetical protein DMF64_16870 [Acidobacteriota bacterium]
MRRKKRTEVFIETEVEIEVKRRTRRLAPVWCEACGAAVEMVPPDVAALVAEVSARTVFGWVEAGRVHFIETTTGALLVCLNSLPQALRAAEDVRGLSTDGAASELSAQKDSATNAALAGGDEGFDSLTDKR